MVGARSDEEDDDDMSVTMSVCVSMLLVNTTSSIMPKILSSDSMRPIEMMTDDGNI